MSDRDSMQASCWHSKITIILLDFSWWDCIWQSAKEQLRRSFEQFGCHVEKATSRRPTLTSLPSDMRFGKKNTAQLVNLNRILLLCHLCKASLGFADCLLSSSASQRKIFWDRLREAPHKMKITSGPSQNKVLPWQGTCWPLAWQNFKWTSAKHVRCHKDNQKGIFRLLVWVGFWPCWASCASYVDYCFCEIVLF